MRGRELVTVSLIGLLDVVAAFAAVAVAGGAVSLVLGPDVAFAIGPAALGLMVWLLARLNRAAGWTLFAAVAVVSAVAFLALPMPFRLAVYWGSAALVLAISFSSQLQRRWLEAFHRARSAGR